MIYEGKAITVKALESGIVELNFDLKGESVNKFNRLTLNELRASVDAIKADGSIKGVIVTSGKDVFIVGADITEFVDNFKLPDAELVAGNLEANKIFSDFEDLAVPTVVAINGIALGGGFEMCLAGDYRVMSETASPTDALKALNAAAGYLHKELVHRLEMRRVPFLTFHLDKSIEEGAAVLAHLDQVIKAEDATGQSS